VRAWVDGAAREGHARLETVLAAGSIGSPAILQRSGIGPAARLQPLGITVREDRPAVGAHLQDHLQLRAVFEVQDARTLNTLVRSPWRKALMGLEYALKRSGPMAMAPSQLGIFARSDAAQARANVQFHVQPLSLARFGGELDPYPAITMSVCNLRPTSRGEVMIRSADAQEAPIIRPAYLSTDEDRRVAVDSLRLARRIVAQPPLQRHAPREVRPGPERLSDAELLQGAGEVGTSIFHPVGSCRMGADADAVVDAQLRVRGVAGLRIADASVMPNITSGNTNTPTAMIALQGAKLIAAARRDAAQAASNNPRT
jgi:choline dehydrogenase